jgi:serine/threonine-protein kinase
MGIVYKAKDKKLEREVAWKVLPRKLSKDKEFQTRFIREARAVAALNHKNIVAVYDIGEEFGESFIAMEFIDGPSLREILTKKKTLTVEEVLDYGKQIAQGLGTAHRRGIIHRDIKPENVMVVSETNEIKVMDFGLARVEEASNLTQEGAIMGTWRYMAPEQVTGKRADSALDVYAVGIMLFEMLTGSPPFTEGDLAYHQVNTTPPEVNELLPDVPDSLNDIIKKCLEKEIDARYADGFELFEALETVDVLQA